MEVKTPPTLLPEEVQRVLRYFDILFPRGAVHDVGKRKGGVRCAGRDGGAGFLIAEGPEIVQNNLRP